MKILVLESSTSSAKAMVYDTKKKLSSVSTKPYSRMFDNMTVHNARTVFDETLSVAKELLNGRSDIDMISLGGTWHSLCLTDKDMNPVTPVLPWCYTGASDLCSKVRKDADYVYRYYHKTGCMVNAIYPFFKLRMLKETGFNLNQYMVAGQNVYNTYRMTGEKLVTECVASGTGLMNIYTKKYEPDLLRELGISESSLPEIISYDRLSPLAKEPAAYLGLKEGIPVLPSNSDGGLNQIGVGALKKGIMTFSVGTSGAIRLTAAEPIIPEEPGTWCYLSPKSWLSGAATSGACNCIDWFKDTFAKAETYENLETGFQADSEQPVFLPFVFGERCPGWNDDRRGIFGNLNASSSIRDLYRAVQEGVLFNLYQCYETLTAVNGAPEHIKLSGGILNSPYWTQMCADIFEKEMEVDKQSQSSLMGGAALAMELAGELACAEDFCVEPVSVVRPDPGRAEAYKKRYQRYLDCYAAL